MLDKSHCRLTNNKEKNEYKRDYTPSVLENDGTGGRDAGLWAGAGICR